MVVFLAIMILLMIIERYLYKSKTFGIGQKDAYINSKQTKSGKKIAANKSLKTYEVKPIENVKDISES